MVTGVAVHNQTFASWRWILVLFAGLLVGDALSDNLQRPGSILIGLLLALGVGGVLSTLILAPLERLMLVPLVRHRGRSLIREAASGKAARIDVTALVGGAGFTLQASGIAEDGEGLLVLQGREVVRVPWNAIRGWEWEAVQTNLPVIPWGFSPIRNAALVSAANSVRAAAFAESGLFIRVADEARPLLRFASDDAGVLAAWDEIITRRVGETTETAPA